MEIKKKYRSVVACAAALACATGLAIVVADAAASSASSPAFGVYDGASTSPTALNSALGGNVKYAMDFLDGSSWSTLTQSSFPYTHWKGAGYSMIWGMPMLPGTYSASSNLSNSSGSCEGLTQEASGAFNSDFAKIAQAMVSNGFGSSVVRPGWEFNGNWFPWSAGGCASAYVGAYQQIVTTMRAVAGSNFTFEWNPTLGDQGIGNLASYYPGNAYVNYIGPDVYDEAGQTYPGAQAEFNTIETESYGLNWMASFASQQGKQIVLPEWGLGWGTCNAGQPISASNGNGTCGGDDPTFINDMSSWIKANNVFEANFWDYGSSSVSGCPNACTPIGSSQSDTNPIAAGNINSFRALVADFGTASGSPATTTTTTTTTTTKPTTTTTAQQATTTTTRPPATTTTTTTSPPSSVNVTHVSPSSGSTAGGTTVTITGSGFSGATVVDFGSSAATIGSVSATSITATAPASAGGTVNVRVITPLGSSPVASTDDYTYIYPKPAVSALSVSAGVAGTAVTITGSGFTGATGVSFGSSTASFTVGSSSSITATVPTGTPTSVVDVTVTGPGGTSNAVAADRFTFGPVVTAVSPASGSHLGGTTITIKGAGLTGATAVSFGGTPVTSAITVNATGTQIAVTAPVHAAGAVDVTVTVGATTTTTSSSDQFTYF